MNCEKGACSKMLHKQVVVLERIFLRQAKEDSKRRCYQEGFQDQVLPAVLRLLQEGPAGGGLGGAEAQVAAQVTEVETARPCKGEVVA